MRRETQSGDTEKRQDADLGLLRLLHLADSALPVGAVPHSFGSETLVESGWLTPARVPSFLRTYLEEAGVMEAVFCRQAFRLVGAGAFPHARWVELNERLSALKVARESRTASTVLGSRLLTLVAGLVDSPAAEAALDAAQRAKCGIHHATAFGLSGAVLAFAEEMTAAAFLHQSISGLVSACQRLMPMGQSEATRIIWELKPAILAAVQEASEFDENDVPSFLPLLDWGAMEHPALTTRLFIS